MIVNEKKMNSKTEGTEKISRGKPLEAITLVLLGCIAFGFPVWKLGWYRDEWYMLWGARTGGIPLMLKMFKTDRPLLGIATAINYRFLGDSALRWHIYGIILRILIGMIFCLILRLIWPKRKMETFFAAALCIVYSGFLQQTNALSYSNHFMAILLGLISIYLTLFSVNCRKGWLKVLCIFLSVGLEAVYLLLLEYLIGFELVRLMLLFLMIRKIDGKNCSQKIIANEIFPAAIMVIFLIWRVFFFKSSRTGTSMGDITQGWKNAPFQALFSLIISVIKDVYAAVIGAEFVPFYQLTVKAPIFRIVIGTFLGCAGILALIFLVIKRIDFHEEQTFHGIPNSDQLEMLSAGFLWTIFMILPVSLTGRQIAFSDMLDRYTLHAAPGACLFLSAVIFYCFHSQKSRVTLCCILVGTSIMANFENNEEWADAWQSQKIAWNQFLWRVPNIKQGTSVAMYLSSPYQLSEGYEVWGPANLIYSPLSGELNPAGDVLNEETFFNISSGMTLRHVMRNMEVVSDFGNGIIAAKGARGCLHVYDKNALSFSSREEPIVRLAAVTSNLKMIDDQKDPADWQKKIFGKEMDRGWCWYYEKADLAVQQGKWEEAARLGDEARANSFSPDAGYESEWLPFYIGYANLGRFDDANETGGYLRLDAVFIHTFCQSYAGKGSSGFLVKNLCGE